MVNIIRNDSTVYDTINIDGLQAQRFGDLDRDGRAGLNFQNIPDPVASPSVNTTYNLTVKDSLGCPAQAKVVVIVEVAAFVPNLFTPNDDGRNDELRIYGLEQVKDFTFTIRNREGNLVYETRNITDAANTGWNGTLHGNQQIPSRSTWSKKASTLNV